MRAFFGIFFFLACLSAAPATFAAQLFKSKPPGNETESSDEPTTDGPESTIISNRKEDKTLAYTPAGNRRGKRANDKCQVFCEGGSEVIVDLGTRCMCTGPGKCFTVQTTNPIHLTKLGTGRLADDVNGTKFKTRHPKNYSSTAAYNKDLSNLNNDALRMGIPGNDGVGRWIHKSYSCGPGGQDFPAAANAGGCIGVPCYHWPEIKAKAGSTLKVCNSSTGQGGSRRNGATNGSR